MRSTQDSTSGAHPTKVAAVDARVVACTAICAEHVAIEIALQDFPHSEPGQFLQLLCRAAEDDAERVLSDAALPWSAFVAPISGEAQPFLRRPFSIANRWRGADGLTHLVVISHAVGRGTRWLAQLKAGDTLSITGPLGKGFVIPPGDGPLLLVGGGVGIPPLLYLARELHGSGRCDVTVVFGARTRALLPLALRTEPDATGAARVCVALPGNADYPATIMSDDGTVGLRGVVTDALRTWAAPYANRKVPAVVLACGPEGMLKAVARLTRALKLECQLCIERNMGCGLGTCLSCVVRLRDAAAPLGWRWGLACSDGPVFSRDDLLDYVDTPRA